MLFPALPWTAGQEWTNPDTQIPYVYDGTIWALLAPEINDAIVTENAMDPAQFQDGKRWFDPVDSVAVIKITDGNGVELWLQDGQGYIPSSWTTWVTVPAAPTDPGELGQIAQDAGFVYLYTPSGSWVRYAKDTWV